MAGRQEEIWSWNWCGTRSHKKEDYETHVCPEKLRERGIVYAEASVLADLLVYAERYALGRMTYAVNDVCTAIRKYKHCLSNKDKAVIVKDIRGCKRLGMKQDEEMWLEVAKELSEEINFEA